MIGWVTKRAVFEHLHKRIIQTANNNVGYVADAGVIISDLADRLQVWLNEMDTVDAVPVVHGRWEYGENESGYDGYYCSKCFGHVRWYGKASEQSINFIEKYNYCPFCGARMDVDDL